MKSGIVIINKEIGMTSQNVVSKVKKILNIKKAGHIGTLDPLAEGVLPVLIGDATKLSKYMINHDKKYVATLKLGIKTETGDNEGKVIEQKEVPELNESQISKILGEFIGKQKQAPHKFSAVKIGGKKLYEYSRSGENVEIPLRDIEIYSIKLISYDCINREIKFEVFCSKGTYIRVLCENVAEKLNTVGYMEKLVRTKVDEFELEKAVKLDELNENSLIYVEDICKKHEKIELDNRKLELFLNGVQLIWNVNEGVYKIYSDNKFIGLGSVTNHLLKRDIIISN